MWAVLIISTEGQTVGGDGVGWRGRGEGVEASGSCDLTASEGGSRTTMNRERGNTSKIYHHLSS